MSKMDKPNKSLPMYTPDPKPSLPFESEDTQTLRRRLIRLQSDHRDARELNRHRRERAAARRAARREATLKKGKLGSKKSLILPLVGYLGNRVLGRNVDKAEK